MQHRLARWLVTAAVLGALALSLPAVMTATASGGCTAQGTSTSGTIDLTTEPVWHLKSTDSAGGSGTAPATMTSASVTAYALGIEIPIPGASGSGKGDTSGSVDNVSLSTFSVLGKVFVVAGHAKGDGGSCDGQVLIILDDVDALFTVLGGGGLVVCILGLAAMLLTGRSGGCLSKIFATFFGGLAGAGLGLSLPQFEVISPTSPVGLAIVILGAILGFVVAVRLGAPPSAATPTGTPPTTPPTPPPTPPTPTPEPTPEPAPDPVSEGAADLLGNVALDDAAREKARGAVTGGAGSTGSGGSGSAGSTPGDQPMNPYDALGTAAQILDAPPPPAPEPPPEDPHAPGVDVGDPSR